MTAYEIGFTRTAEAGEAWDPCLDVRQGAPTVYDTVELDVSGNDPAELLSLFGNFIAENGFQIEGGIDIEEIEGREAEVFA